MIIDLNNIRILLDPSVKHITNVASMVLSGTIENGIILSNNPTPNIVIYKDRIDFGRCMDINLDSISGLIFPNFYKEYDRIVYRYGDNLKCSFFGKTLDYVGIMAPSVPDNDQLFHIIYPRFS